MEGNYATILTENNGSNIRVLANNISFQNWGQKQIAAGVGLTTNLAAASNATVMTIVGCNVGIGSAVPAASLDVVGNVNVSGNFTRNGIPLAATNWQQSGTTTFLATGSNLGIGTTNTQGYDLYVAGEVSASKVYARNGFFIANDNQAVRNALQLAPLKANLTISASEQSVFTFTQTGIYTATASNADVFVNGVKLVYRDVNTKDYDMSYSWIGLSNTQYTITLVEPVTFGDVVDVAIWPSFYQTASSNLPGYVYQTFGSYQWQNTGINNTFALGNVGIGTTNPLYILDVNGTIASSLNPTLPSLPGLVGWYTGDSWTGTQWSDLSGAGNHATVITGTITKATIPNTTIPFIYGGTTAAIVFPSAILPTIYTIFHVIKYNGTNRKRILTNANGLTINSVTYTGVNWWSGHKDTTGGGVNASGNTAYHNGVFIANETSIGLTDNWIISTDRRNSYRSQGIDRTKDPAPSGGTNTSPLTINGYTVGESSDWAAAEIIVYNRELSLSEIQNVEAYLINKYANTTTGFDANYNFSSLLAANVSGTNLLTVNSKGNVGIGTTNPQFLLDINGEFASRNFVVKENVGSTNDFVIFNRKRGVGLNTDAMMRFDTNGAVQLQSSSGQSIVFQNANSTRMIIKSDGNVGIGTTNPGYQFQITNTSITGTGNYYVYGKNASQNNQIELGYHHISDGSANNYGSLGMHSSSTLFWTGSSRIGIGTTNPSSRLHIVSPSNSLIQATTDTNAANQVSGIEFGIPAAVRSRITSTTKAGDKIDMTFTVQNGANTPVTAMSIKEDGNVGIGTTNPLERLHVHNGSIRIGNIGANTTIQTSGQLILRSNDLGNSTFVHMVYATGSNTSTLGDHIWYTQGNSERMRMLSNGNVGIGTTNPQNRLDVNGSCAIGTYAGVNESPANSLIVSGNVGIGTTNPQTSLDVNGILVAKSVVTTRNTGFTILANGSTNAIILGPNDKGGYLLSVGCAKLNNVWDHTIHMLYFINVGANSTNTTASATATKISGHGNLSVSTPNAGNNIVIQISSVFISQIFMIPTLLKICEPPA